MKNTSYISDKINRLPKGYIFTYTDFLPKVKNKESIIKTLNRMAESGKISKFSKGKYYKPEETPYGKLQPNNYEMVKDLLEENGKISGYLTGYSIYNQLGLTTQVGNIIQIGKNNTRPTFKRGEYIISFILQKNLIAKDNVFLLQILDSIKFIKKIPDTNILSSFKRLIQIIAKLSEKEKVTIVRLALKYSPATRALLGAILDEEGSKVLTKNLYESLNPITTYKFPGIKNILPSVNKWNIK